MTDAHDLYGLPLEQFVSERDAAAKTLRSQGRREEAARIAALRKPSVAAWAVNQLVRTQGRAIAALFAAGDALQRAQSELLAGRAVPGALRQATERERAAVDGLAEAARGLLSSEGRELSPATLDRVAETLRAAALDDDARAQAQDGCLEHELRHVGLGASASLSAQDSSESAGTRARPARTTAKRGSAPPSSAKSTPIGKSTPTGKHHAERRAQAEQAARKRADALRAAGKAEADARRVAERAVRELAAAQARRDRAAGSLREAEDALAAARGRAEDAELAHRRAQQSLGRAQESPERA